MIENDETPDDEDRSDESYARPEDLTDHAADAILECVGESVDISRAEALTIADEILNEYTTLKGERALGANATVYTINDPRGGFEGSRSIKAGNILINLGSVAKTSKLLPIAVSTAFTAYISEHPKYAIVMFIFSTLNAVRSLRELDLSQRLAGVLYTMWQSRSHEDNTVAHEGLLERVNKQFIEFEWNAIEADEMISILEKLERIKCIEKIDPYHSLMMTGVKYLLKENIIASL